MPGPQPRPVIERLLTRIELDEHGCWLWGGIATAKGYGQITVGSTHDGTMRREYTHRVACEFYNGPIPAGFEVDHLCRVARCCNPDHLEAVTHSENQMRGNNGSRMLVCSAGHSLLGDDVSIRPNGYRRCLKCIRLVQ